MALSAYSTNASFTAIGTEQADASAPAASTSCAIINMGDYNNLVLFPTGTDAENETHSRRVYGVKPVLSSAGAVLGYHRKLLCEVQCTNSSVGVATAINGNQANAFWCDTITYSSGPYSIDAVGIQNSSNANNVPASLTIDTTGYPVVEVRYAINTGSGAAMNDFYFKF